MKIECKISTSISEVRIKRFCEYKYEYHSIECRHVNTDVCIELNTVCAMDFEIIIEI